MLLSPSNSQWDVSFHGIAYDYSDADWYSLDNYLRDFPWEVIFKLSASAAVSEFCEWVQVRIDVYIPHCKYQVKPHSSLWLSADCAATIVHRNHFFRLFYWWSLYLKMLGKGLQLKTTALLVFFLWLVKSLKNL